MGLNPNNFFSRTDTIRAFLAYLQWLQLFLMKWQGNGLSLLFYDFLGFTHSHNRLPRGSFPFP